MTESALKIVAETMSAAGMRYAYGEYAEKPIEYPYFVGEYTEYSSLTEDGKSDCRFEITAYGRNTYAELEECKQKIIRAFGGCTGINMIAENGNGVAICFDNAFPVQTWDEELKKMQINLNIYEWENDAE